MSNDSKTVSKRVSVQGRVQGVGFRAFTKRVASRHDVKGWVRNEPDGTVTAVLQGDQAAVNDVLDAVKDGPRTSHVDGHTVTDVEPERFDDFTIKYHRA